MHHVECRIVDSQRLSRGVHARFDGCPGHRHDADASDAVAAATNVTNDVLVDDVEIAERLFGGCESRRCRTSERRSQLGG